MQVILIEDVKSLGKAGTLVKVNDSYGRNYLIPRKLGVEANAANLNNLKLRNANEEKIEAAKLENAKEVKAAVTGKAIKIAIKTGKDGKLFGSITAADIADAIKAQTKIEVDKKKIVMDPIKETGEHTIKLKLHKDVQADVKVSVVAEE